MCGPKKTNKQKKTIVDFSFGAFSFRTPAMLGIKPGPTHCAIVLASMKDCFNGIKGISGFSTLLPHLSLELIEDLESLFLQNCQILATFYCSVPR